MLDLSPVLIPTTEATEFQGELYADPLREIYHALGLVESLKMAPSGEPRKSYVPGVVTSALKSIWASITRAYR